jgi:predicted DNA-binding transcriptional regulator AlpA
MQAKVVRIADIATTPNKPGMLPVSPATIWRWVRDGKFPKPFNIGARTTVWDYHEIQTYIARQAGTPS